jgi:hypothetical protein
VSAFSYVLNLVSFDCVGCQSGRTKLWFTFQFWRTSSQTWKLKQCCRIFKGQEFGD